MKRVLTLLACMVAIAVHAQLVPPPVSDTIFGHPDNYLYYTWYDTCPRFYDTSHRWFFESGISMRSENSSMEFYPYIPDGPTPIVGAAVLVVRNGADIGSSPALTCWYAARPEYAKIWLPTDSLPVVVDSARWDTVMPRMMAFPANYLDTDRFCLVYEARFKTPIMMDSMFFFSLTNNSYTEIPNQPNVMYGWPVIYAYMHGNYYPQYDSESCTFGDLYGLLYSPYGEVLSWGPFGYMRHDWGFVLPIMDDRWRLDAVSCDSTMGSARGSGVFFNNTSHAIWALAETGFHFTQWSDGNTDNPRQVVLTQDTLFTAMFVQGDSIPQFAVEVFTENSLKGTVSGSGVYDSNAVATISATGWNGYRFDRWNDGDTTNPRGIVVVSDTAFTAYFVSEPIGEDTTQNAIRMVEIPDVTLSPNPTNGKVKVSASEPIRQVAVYDMAGKQVYDTTRRISHTTLDMDLSALPSGTYIVKVATKSHTTTRKLVVE